MPFLFILFIIVPLLEIYLFIQVGDQVGALTTVALVVLTAAIGVVLLRWQGVKTLIRARERMAAGELPAQQMLEGMLLAVGGILLLVPGFFTDAIGFALLIPPLRRGIYQLVKARAVVVNVNPRRRQPPGQGDTIDGEYRRDDRDDDPTLPPRQ